MMGRSRSTSRPRASVAVVNCQKRLAVDERRVASAVRAALASQRIRVADISVAVVDNRTIRRVNRRFLGHDYATDVVSFLLNGDPRRPEGEIVVSAATASAAAPRYGWSVDEELLLYVVHGALHLAGHDDRTPAQRAKMRALEASCLRRLGIRLPAAPPARSSSPTRLNCRVPRVACPPVFLALADKQPVAPNPTNKVCRTTKVAAAAPARRRRVRRPS